MTDAIAQSAGNAKFDTEKNCRRSGKTLPPIDAVMRLARILWPAKTDLELSTITKASDRTCRYWLSRKTDLSADALAELLRSEHGLKFIEAIIGDARPKWWRAFKQSTDLGLLRQRHEELRREIERVERDYGE